MRGKVITDCINYGFDNRYNTFDVNLPQPAKKDNVIHVLIPKNYPYMPKVSDVIEFSGNVTTYDEKVLGLQTYVLIISLYESTFEDFDIKDNNITVTGRVFKKDKIGKTRSGIQIQRLSISVNTDGRYVPIHCIGHDIAAVALDKLEKNQIAEISGRLVSREFMYREDAFRVTTELIVEYVYPINQ